MRAAVAALQGTAGEPAIEVYLSGEAVSVSFVDLPSHLSHIIAAIDDRPDGTQSIDVNSRNQYEDFALLSNTMAHEALHIGDSVANQKEEFIASSIDTLICAEMVLASPQISRSGTELARRLNTPFLARLNTRDDQGDLRLFESEGNVFPCGKPLDSWGDIAPGVLDGPADDGNPALAPILSNVTDVNVQSADFDNETIELLDRYQEVLSPRELVRMARILKLDLSPTPRCPDGSSPTAVDEGDGEDDEEEAEAEEPEEDEETEDEETDDEEETDDDDDSEDEKEN